eukprot:s2017_g4.t1
MHDPDVWLSNTAAGRQRQNSVGVQEIHATKSLGVRSVGRLPIVPFALQAMLAGVRMRARQAGVMMVDTATWGTSSSSRGQYHDFSHQLRLQETCLCDWFPGCVTKI